MVDVTALGGRRTHQATQRIMARVMEEEEEDGASKKHDHVEVLRRVRACMDAVGLAPPVVTVRFWDLSRERSPWQATRCPLSPPACLLGWPP